MAAVCLALGEWGQDLRSPSVEGLKMNQSCGASGLGKDVVVVDIRAQLSSTCSARQHITSAGRRRPQPRNTQPIKIPSHWTPAKHHVVLGLFMPARHHVVPGLFLDDEPLTGYDDNGGSIPYYISIITTMLYAHHHIM